MFLLKKSLQSDLEYIAVCHAACFPDSLNVSLGKNYIAKTFEWFLISDNRFLFHAVSENNTVAGYCGGFIPQYEGDGSTSGMMKYAMKEAFRGVIKNPFLIFNKEVIEFYPLIFKNIYSKIFSKKKKPETATLKPVLKKKAGLVVIGVHPAFRGHGVFEMLMNKFEEEAAALHVFNLKLSVRNSNARAIAAYKKAGWQKGEEKNNALSMYKNLSEKK